MPWRVTGSWGSLDTMSRSCGVLGLTFCANDVERITVDAVHRLGERALKSQFIFGQGDNSQHLMGPIVVVPGFRCGDDIALACICAFALAIAIRAGPFEATVREECPILDEVVGIYDAPIAHKPWFRRTSREHHNKHQAHSKRHTLTHHSLPLFVCWLTPWAQWNGPWNHAHYDRTGALTINCDDRFRQSTTTWAERGAPASGSNAQVERANGSTQGRCISMQVDDTAR